MPLGYRCCKSSSLRAVAAMNLSEAIRLTLNKLNTFEQHFPTRV
jgi:hypothetical protein